MSNHPYRPLAMPFRVLDVVARIRYKSLGGQYLIVAAIPGLSQERCCETARADVSVQSACIILEGGLQEMMNQKVLSVAWEPPASPFASSSARMCIGKGRVLCRKSRARQ